MFPAPPTPFILPLLDVCVYERPMITSPSWPDHAENISQEPDNNTQPPPTLRERRELRGMLILNLTLRQAVASAHALPSVGLPGQ